MSWIGAFRTGKYNDNSNWSWVTGQAMIYDNWTDDNPSNYDSNEFCAEMNVDDHDSEWNDTNCDASFGYVTDFICQK